MCILLKIIVLIRNFPSIYVVTGRLSHLLLHVSLLLLPIFLELLDVLDSSLGAGYQEYGGPLLNLIFLFLRCKLNSRIILIICCLVFLWQVILSLVIIIWSELSIAVISLYVFLYVTRFAHLFLEYLHLLHRLLLSELQMQDKLTQTARIVLVIFIVAIVGLRFLQGGRLFHFFLVLTARYHINYSKRFLLII